LLACCRKGELAFVANVRPEKETEANRVRAAFVRFLLLGGDERTPVHEHGVQLEGAWLTGVLDIGGAQVERRLGLRHCAIERIDAVSSKVKLVSLEGCLLSQGMAGESLIAEGGLYLREGFQATGAIRLVGAVINGDLDCSGGRFDNDGGVALDFDGAAIFGAVFAGFEATGEIRMVGAMVGGDLSLRGASLGGEGDTSLSGDSAHIKGRLFFDQLKEVKGEVRLPGAHVGTLCDDGPSWELARGRVVLDGFRYDRFLGSAPVDAKARIWWLHGQVPDHLADKFRPQPWEQLISVLRAMGHPEEARAIAVEKQRRLRKARRLPRGARPLHWLYGLLIGYGYRPMRLLAATASVWLICFLAYWAATNPSVFDAETYLLAPPNREASVNPQTPDYGAFVPLIYSADVLLPVIDLGYKDEWQPVVGDRAGNPLIWGQLLRFLYWFEIAFGWVAGLLLVGVLGNLIKKD